MAADVIPLDPGPTRSEMDEKGARLALLLHQTAITLMELREEYVTRFGEEMATDGVELFDPDEPGQAS